MVRRKESRRSDGKDFVGPFLERRDKVRMETVVKVLKIVSGCEKKSISIREHGKMRTWIL